MFQIPCISKRMMKAVIEEELIVERPQTDRTLDGKTV